ncbi:hypothetical protein CCR94_14890 [Rhodoblastus sphagnicola]|uniref:Uncharacterized protein n=2 Tax=Rhodoblastus sphagnicola TaxID=333368 RepID=A0A2S6N4S7_9HYPH|nr:hypothetical protein CCR94_14890 [Rhodoblastus sphagnicola]
MYPFGMKTTLALISLAALAGATGVAMAGNCPRGQIYRVSKHVCVDHDEAVKLGIAHGLARDAAKPEADKPEAAPQADTAPAAAEPAVEPAPAPEAVATPPVEPEPEARPVRVKSVRTVKIPPKSAPDTAAPASPPATEAPKAAAPAPVEAEAAPAKNPFGALDPSGVPMSQAR